MSLQQLQEAIDTEENAAQNIDIAWRNLLDELAVITRAHVDPYHIARLENI
jgi:ribonuclease D